MPMFGVMKQAHKSLIQLNLICLVALKSFQNSPIHVSLSYL